MRRRRRRHLPSLRPRVACFLAACLLVLLHLLHRSGDAKPLAAGLAVLGWCAARLASSGRQLRAADARLERCDRTEASLRADVQSLAASERFARSVVDALRAHIAILDEQGRILAVNAAWRSFAAENGGEGGEGGEGGRAASRWGEGANYLDACDAAAAAGDAVAGEVAAGIRAVLRRERDAFDCEYPCHSPGRERWFTMRVTRFAEAAGHGGDAAPAAATAPARAVVCHEDVTERVRAERRVRFQKALLEAQAEASVDGILVSTAEGKVLSYNRRFAEMWRLPQDVLDTRSDAAMLDAVTGNVADARSFLARVRHLYAHPDETGQDEIALKDGRTLDRYGASITLDGARVARVWFFRDVTEQKRAAELERERAGLREAVAGMEQVLGVVGHELRTPLAGLRAISEFLLTDAARGTAEFDGFLKGMNDEVVRMSDLVNNLLEAARLNSGKARWNFRDFHLSRACEEALDCVRPLVDASRLAVSYEVTPPDLRMHGDADGLRRLIINLTTNSRKHTQQGRIHVAVTARSDEDGDWVDVRVSDTGRGIPPDVLARLGDAFALNSGFVGAHPAAGTGLGIAICKAIIAAHGGSLRVESTVGRGTTVTASLRADLQGPVAPAPPEMEPPGAPRLVA